MYTLLQEQLPPTATNVIDSLDTSDEAFASVIDAADEAMVDVIVFDTDLDAHEDELLAEFVDCPDDYAYGDEHAWWLNADYAVAS